MVRSNHRCLIRQIIIGTFAENYLSSGTNHFGVEVFSEIFKISRLNLKMESLPLEPVEIFYFPS